MGWLAIMYQERKRKTHIWLKVDKNSLISSLKDQYSSFNINDFKRFKCSIKSYFFLGQKKEQWDYNKGNMLRTSKWTLRLPKTKKQKNKKQINNRPKIMTGSKLTRVIVSTLLSSRFSNHFYPSTSCVWVATCMCNELSMKAMKFFKQE